MKTDTMTIAMLHFSICEEDILALNYPKKLEFNQCNLSLSRNELWELLFQDSLLHECCSLLLIKIGQPEQEN